MSDLWTLLGNEQFIAGLTVGWVVGTVLTIRLGRYS